MIKNKQELRNYFVDVLRDLYNEIDTEPMTKEQNEVLEFCEELSKKVEELR